MFYNIDITPGLLVTVTCYAHINVSNDWNRQMCLQWAGHTSKGYSINAQQGRSGIRNKRSADTYIEICSAGQDRKRTSTSAEQYICRQGLQVALPKSFNWINLPITTYNLDPKSIPNRPKTPRAVQMLQVTPKETCGTHRC